MGEHAADQAQQPPQPQRPPQPLWHSFVAGAASGLAARVVTFPADTLKARLQVSGAIPVAAGAATSRPYGGTTAAAARHVLAAEGLRGFYAGFGAVLWGVVPANLAYFGGYEAGKRLLPAQQLGSVGADMATGAFAQLLAGVVYTPIDIVKERLQVQAMMGGAYSYGSPRAAFAALLQTGRGGLSGVFRGYWATNCVWLPWNALYIAGYEQAKRSSCAALQCSEPQQLPAWAVASCSASAAAAAAVATHPFDVVKTRLQVLTAQPSGEGLTALGLAAQQWRREGGRSFFHGLTARLLNIAPGCALSWALYEHLKAWLDDDD